MYRGAIIDIDGTLVRGETILPGVDEAFSALERSGVEPVLLSNNPTRSGEHYRTIFADTAIDVETTPILTSATISAKILADRHGDESGLIIGESTLTSVLTGAGLALTHDPESADYVLASMDPSISYDTLTDAQRALDRGIPFYGTDPDPRIPSENGPVPGSGTIIAALEAASGRSPDAIFGKPSTEAATTALAAVEGATDETIVVGDRLDTDIELGRRAGLDTVLVRSEVTTTDGTVEPDHVLESVGQLETILE